MKKVFFIATVLAAFSLQVSAQIRKVPADVTNAFSAKYKDASNVEWKDVLKSFAATYDLDGVKYVSKFNKKGQWISTENQIEENDLPNEVKDGYQKSKYSDWQIEGAYYISLPGDVVQYRIHVAKSGIQQKNLLFDDNGKLLKDNLTL